MARKVEIEWNEKTVRSTILEEADAIMGEGVEFAEDVARASARYDTGLMHDETHGTRVGPLDYVLHSDVHYSFFNEVGTRYKEAKPFIRPGARAGQRQMMAEYRRVFHREGRRG